MTTWYQDNAEILKIRPYFGRPEWELRNMIKALSLMTWLNSPEDTKRREDAKLELKLRRKK